MTGGAKVLVYIGTRQQYSHGRFMEFPEFCCSIVRDGKVMQKSKRYRGRPIHDPLADNSECAVEIGQKLREWGLAVTDFELVNGQRHRFTTEELVPCDKMTTPFMIGFHSLIEQTMAGEELTVQPR